MFTFALLESELSTCICRPRIRGIITSMLREVKGGGEYRVPGWSPDGVRVILNSGVLRFRTLYMVVADRCDCGSLHTNDAVYCVSSGEDEEESVMRLIYNEVSLHVNRIFEGGVPPDYDEENIVPPDGVAAGVIIYDDPEEKVPQSLFFANRTLGPKEGVSIVCQAISKYFAEGEDDDDEEGD